MSQSHPPARHDGTEVPPAGLWDRMKADPQYAPEHLALEAVRRLGPEARDWANRVRAQRPGIGADELVGLAVKKFVARARLSGAVSGAAGLPGAIVDVGVLAWTQARLVLHLAAAHGVDPRHPDRATDLLVLQKVHKVAEAARLALGVAAGRERLPGPGSTPLGRVMLRLGFRLAQMAGIRAAKRMFAKAVPGAAIILGTWANSTATNDLARRAIAHYRVPPTGPAGTGGPGSAQPGIAQPGVPHAGPAQSGADRSGAPQPGPGQPTALA
nr:EcsC family protein [Micromonospora sp. DSM 115978]